MIHGSTKVGEIFLCNEKSGGQLEVMEQYLGKAITGLGGGCDKMFVMEGMLLTIEGFGYEGVVSDILEDQGLKGINQTQRTSQRKSSVKHSVKDSQQSDYEDQRDEEDQQDEPSKMFNQTDPNANRPGSNEMQSSHLKQIVAGKNHIMRLTIDGFVFSYGTGDFSAAGHGGSSIALTPQIIRPLSDKRVIQIACGEYHSLVLTDKYDVYSWGRGFEGQLGLSKSVEVASTPQYIKSFFGKPIYYIAAGAYYSVGITNNYQLYGWGEAKLGQLGLGKRREIKIPELIQITDEQDYNKSAVSVNAQEQSKSSGKIIQVSCGYGHTVILTDEGELFVFGFNCYGQLGVGDQKTRFYPTRILTDIVGNSIPPIQKIACGYYATFCIDYQGKLYSWGRGFIGHKGQTDEDLPRKIELNTENRIFTDIFCNQNSFAFYAPVRVYSISPKCGPSYGGTILSVIGTGLKESENLRVRFTYGDLSQEVKCQFDHKMKSIFCRTPKFEEFETHPSLQLPCNCTISVTLDGINYSECDDTFQIYSNDLQLSSINPKCGSVMGGSEMSLHINIDEQLAQNLFHLTVGFQPKQLQKVASKKQDNVSQKSGDEDKKLNQSHVSSMRASRVNSRPEDDMLRSNPLDVQIHDPELEKENWSMSAGHYENGKIICIVPDLSQYDPENLQFNVDVAINGQQFTGKPLPFRYYDIHIEQIEPSLGPSEGGTVILIKGQGLYDAAGKRIKFQTTNGERQVTANWDRKKKALSCIVPPLTWLYNGEEVSEEVIEKTKNEPIQVFLSFNGQEWIQSLEFKYHDMSVTRVAYSLNYGEGLEEEEKEKMWLAEEALEQIDPDLTEEEQKKKDEDAQAKCITETEEASTLARRPGTKLIIHANNLIHTEDLSVRFTIENVKFDTQCIYKNSKKVVLLIPDLGEEVPVGQHLCSVDISLNGQQYTQSAIQFLYNSFDRNLSEEELKKLDEADEKAKGGQAKPTGKKK